MSSVVSDSATPWTVARQAPLCMRFPRQEYWSGLPFPTPGGLSDPRIEPTSLGSLALAGRFFTPVPLGHPVLRQETFSTIFKKKKKTTEQSVVLQKESRKLLLEPNFHGGLYSCKYQRLSLL